MEQICIFWDKKDTYLTGSKTREPLMQSLELRSDAKVRQAAIKKLDNKILAITSQIIVAAEAHYHKTCYRNYTRDEKPKAATAIMTNAEVAYQEAEQQSFLMLFKYIRDTMFTDPQAIRLTHLAEKLVEFMKTYGYDDVKQQIKNHTRRRLDADFVDSLHFISEENGRVLVYPDNLSLAQALRYNFILKDKIQELESTNDIRNIIKQSAVHIRGQIKSMSKMPWPPNPDELNANYLKLPETLILLISNLLIRKSVEGTPRQQRVVQSLGQDCVYVVSGGLTIPAKNILLPWGFKSLTGNVEVIRVLNRLQLDMKDVLQHPLGPLPWTLANDDGSLKKTNKSALARKLERNSSAAETIPQPSACIIDVMSLLHKMRGDNMTFEELSGQLLASVLRSSVGSTRVDLIFDVYKQISIKKAERALRGSDQGIRFTNIVAGHKIQQWRRLLLCGTSKMNLISFILEQWRQPQRRQQLSQRTVYFTSGEKRFKLSSNSVSEVTELENTHEEADTRILLHAKHASGNYSSIVIVAEDTDVFIPCLAFQSKINSTMYSKIPP